MENYRHTPISRQPTVYVVVADRVRYMTGCEALSQAQCLARAIINTFNVPTFIGPCDAWWHLAVEMRLKKP